MVGPMVGYGWIHTPSYTIQPNPFVCPCIQTNTILHIFLDQRKKKVRKCMSWGGTGSPLLGIHFWVNHDWMWSWLDLVGYTQNSVHLPL